LSRRSKTKAEWPQISNRILKAENLKLSTFNHQLHPECLRAQPFCHCKCPCPSYDAEGIFMATGKIQKQSSGGSALGFEATLWASDGKSVNHTA